MDIRPLLRPNYDCYASLIHSFGKSVGKGHELAFLSRWSFVWQAYGGRLARSGIGRNLLNNYSVDATTLEEVHGITIVPLRVAELDAAIQMIAEQVRSGAPIVVCVTVPHCPWHPLFERSGGSHFIMITGQSREGMWSIVDPTYSLERLTMTNDQLRSALYGPWRPEFWAGETSNFELMAVLKSTLPQRRPDAVKHALRSAMQSKAIVSMAESMHECAEALRSIRSSSEWELEWADVTPGISHTKYIPLIFHLRTIEWNRRNFSEAVRYAEPEVGISGLADAATRLIQIATGWETVRLTLMKNAVSGFVVDRVEFAADQIDNIAAAECEAFNELGRLVGVESGERVLPVTTTLQ
ncbi:MULTISPECIES: hypothetical protein [unclassified Bradyrhizobium]|uniref:hypothetical protein n=1 Tax=unclassified Bradyrhizobium TaxID=2631580 RepID=UPI002916A45C|nr:MULTISPECIES: hypothetical protein [unclassified Bradyrhizobium]